MKITSYSFGRIVIDKQEYSSDLILFPDRILPSWWRKEGHSLEIEDLQEVLNSSPKIIVVGTGSYGVLKVPQKTKDFLQEKGIKLIIKETKEACKIFNELMEANERVVGCFHLTC